MYIEEKNCIICEIDKNISLEQIKDFLPYNTFESFNINKLNEDYSELEFKWLDSIRVRDKIVSRKQKSVKSWLHLNKNSIIIFGNSESDINFFLTKIKTFLHISVRKAQVFENFTNSFLNNKPWLAKLISIHIRNKIVPHDENKIRKLQTNNLTTTELQEYLKEKWDLVVNLTFTYSHIIFYMDSKSIISFPDTINFEEIMKVLKEVLNDQK